MTQREQPCKMTAVAESNDVIMFRWKVERQQCSGNIERIISQLKMTAMSLLIASMVLNAVKLKIMEEM